MQAHAPKKLRQPEALAAAHCHYYSPACPSMIWPRWLPPVEDRQMLKAARPTMAWEALVEDEARVALPPLLRLGGRPIDWPAKRSWVVQPEEAVAPRVVLPWQLLFARLSNIQLPTGSMIPEKEVEAEEAWEQEQEPHYSCLKVGSKVVSERMWKVVMVQASEVVIESLVLAAAWQGIVLRIRPRPRPVGRRVDCCFGP